METALRHASIGVRCELPLFFAGIRQAVRRRKALRSRKLKYAVSAELARRLNNYGSFKILHETLKNFARLSVYDAPLEGSTVFRYCSSTCCMSMKSCQLPELKYAIFCRTGRNTKKLPRSKLFLSMVFKHGLLEGSTTLLRYSAITRTPLESSS